VLDESLAHGAVDAVGRHDQIARRQVGQRAHVRFEVQPHPERPGALLHQQQKLPARAAAESVAADALDVALAMDLDVVPIGEGGGELGVALLVVGLEGVERLVGEHHAEAEGVVGAVALVDVDLGLRGRPSASGWRNTGPPARRR
jgi:hypothetical protein